MPINRTYQAQPLSVQQTLLLDQSASHHLIHVLRAKLGQQITLFNGLGGEYGAEITQLSKRGVEVVIHSHLPREVESKLKIHLAQGIAKGEKMDWIVQKAVELGVDEITPLMTERSQVKLNAEREAKRIAHWQSIIISACEQCGRNRLPRLNSPISFSAWVLQEKVGLIFALAPNAQEKITQLTLNDTNISLVIGPEGGLSEKELQQANSAGIKSLNLGPRILRTETATISALSILQFQFGDLS